MSGTASLITVIEFQDGTCSVQEVHRGTIAECKELIPMIDAISYSGDKPASKSYLRIVDSAQLDAALAP